MPPSEPMGEERRVALSNRLIETLGEEEARTLMESLPPVLWTHLATKDDIKASEERLRTEFNGQFAQFLATITNEFAKVNGEFAKVHARMDRSEAMAAAEFKSVRAEIANSKAETTLQAAKQTRTMVITLVGFALSIWIPLLVVGLS